jgi:hypothetical protein
MIGFHSWGDEQPFETAGKKLAGIRLESGWNLACHFFTGR